MGNCVKIRENKQENEEADDRKILNMKHYLMMQMMKVEEAKQKRLSDVMREIRKYNRGGVNSSEEEDEVIVPKMGYQSINQSVTHQSHNYSRAYSHVQSQQDKELISVQGEDHIKGAEENGNGNDMGFEAQSVNSEDELKDYFGGEASTKKHILTSMINQPAPVEEDIKVFPNTVFKKEDSEEQNAVNVFSDNDISFDQSPDMKRH